jgi:hypothetical protein
MPAMALATQSREEGGELRLGRGDEDASEWAGWAEPNGLVQPNHSVGLTSGPREGQNGHLTMGFILNLKIDLKTLV